MVEDELDELKEKHYMRGQQAVYRSLLSQCLSHLEGNEKTRTELLLERNETLLRLRDLCKEMSVPADWPENLYLPDIIEKYILRGLQNQEKRS